MIALDLMPELCPPPPYLEIPGCRPYQHDMLRSISDGWVDDECQRQLIVSATGTGKTVAMGGLARTFVEDDQRVLMLAHTDELIEQARDKFSRLAGVEAEKEKAGDRASLSAPLVVGSVQTLRGVQRLMSWPRDHFGLVMVDECFPGDVLVDGIPISQIQVGHFVRSYNHVTQRVERRRVTYVFKKAAPAAFIRITLRGGRTVACTPNHPFYTDRGYADAASINAGDLLYGDTEMLPMWMRGCEEMAVTSEQSVLQSLCDGAASGAREEDRSNVQVLRDDGDLPGKQSVLRHVGCCAPEEGVLLSDVLPELEGKVFAGREKFIGVQQDIWASKNDSMQPDAGPKQSGKNDREDEGSHIPVEGRKWAANLSAAKTCASVGVADGAPDRDSSGENAVREPAELLQGGHCGPRYQDGDRGGREDTSIEKMEVSGRQKNKGLECVRVVRVEVLELGGGRGPSALCGDGLVYNLEVEGNHNYFVGEILVHNCHRTLAKSYLTVLHHFETARVVGVTATADRGDKKELGKFYQRMAYDYSMLNACRDGWLVRPIVQTLPLQIDLSKGGKLKVKRSMDGGMDFDMQEVGHRLEPLLGDLARAIYTHAHDRRILGFAPSIDIAQKMAQWCRDVGFSSADWVAGEDKQRHEKIAAYKAGRIRVLWCAMLLTEGFDHDEIDCIVPLRPTLIRALYVQMVGRGTRPLSSIVPALNAAATAEERCRLIKQSAKPHVLLLDPLWLYEQHDLTTAACLVSKNVEEQKLMAGKQGDLLEMQERAARDLIDVLREKILANQNKRAARVDPFTFGVVVGDDMLATYQPETLWDARQPTIEQLKVLVDNGIEAELVQWRGQAQRIVEVIQERRDRGLCSVRLMNWLRRHGIDAALMTQDEATKNQRRLFATGFR